MKKSIVKNISTFSLIVVGVFSTRISQAQYYYYPTCTCVSNNPPGYCYTDKNGNIKCQKFHSNNGNDGGGGACICAIASHQATGEFSSNENYSEGIYPNPLMNSTTIYVTVREAQKISLKVFDLSGKLITTLVDGSTSAGEHRLEWNAATVKAGVYILRLQTSESIQTKKLIVAK